MKGSISVGAVLLIGAALATQAGAQVGVPITGKKKVLLSPVRIAAAADQRLLVSDYKQQCIATVDPARMAVVSTMPVGGRVTGVAALGTRIYVGNETTGGIEMYDQDGSFLGFLGGDGLFVLNPSDLAVDAGQNLLFALDGEDRAIKVFSLEGQGSLVATISGPGLEDHLFQRPTGIAIDPVAGEVFVTDYGAVEDGVEPRVVIFGYDGSYHGSVSGEDGTHGYYFSKPQGLAVGQTGHIFVVDAWLGRVVIMDRVTGDEVATLGEFGTRRGQLRLPLDALILGENQDLFVTSGRTRRVEVFPEGGRL